MSIKNLFNKNAPVTSKNLQEATLDYEDGAYLQIHSEDKNKFKPYVDYSNPENFCFYALAEQYYADAFDRITNTYPYDGSTKERKEWHLSSSNFDLYVLENLYPRTNGHIQLGTSWSENATATFNSKNYAEATAPEYLNIRKQMNTGSISAGGMTDISVNFSASNIYDTTYNRDSNLEFDLDNGVSVEFWFKHGAQAGSPTEVLFDLWNGQETGSAAAPNEDYGRLTIETTGSISGSINFLVTAQSGSTGLFQQSLGTVENITDWKHYGIRIFNTGSNIGYDLFIDGELNDSNTGGTNINAVTGSLTANIGSFKTAPSGSTTVSSSWGSVSGSFDEFRFWKEKRSHRDIARFYFTNVEAGTNKSDAETSLGFYYKFNEGVTQRSSYDSIVLDYSGRTTNADWVNYVSGSRSTSSAIVEASAAASEFQDPILWNFHPTVLTQKALYVNSGSSYDILNNSAIYNSIPEWVLEEDLGEWKRLSQIIGAYFDNLHLLVKEVPKLKNIQYPSGSDKPYVLADKLLTNSGIDTIALFDNVSSLESLYNRDEDRDFESTLTDIKNTIFLNIYNNVVDLYKQKGTVTALRNLLHCFGIDEKLININIYADNDVYEVRQNFTPTSIKKKFADFNNVDRFGSSIYQQTSSAYPESLGYIYGSGQTRSEINVPITMETEVLFPKKPDHSINSWASSSFTLLTSSLFGCHTAITGSGIDETTWETGSIADMQVYAVRDQVESENVYFVCRSSTENAPLPTLTSSLVEEVYDNQNWNLAVKVYPTKRENAGISSGSTSGSNTYSIEFYGVSTVLGSVINEFNVTGTMSHEDGAQFLSSPKRFYLGAHKENFTGSVQQYSDVKIGSLRYWPTYLENSTIKEHNIDSENRGNNYSLTDTYKTIDGINFKNIQDSELLALDWQFDKVTGSNADGSFVVEDFTSGSATYEGRYGTIGTIVGSQYLGIGHNFPSTETEVVDNVYLTSGKYTPIEQVDSTDMIQIYESDRVEQVQDARPVKFILSLEKSMYRSISNEMIEWLGSVNDFNNLLGEPIHRYHMFYKGMENLRYLFFEHVENDPDFEKFIDLYKWIDNSLSTVVAQFIPASARSDKKIRTVIESHVLERPKVWQKWPTMEYEQPELNVPVGTINKLLFPFKFGTAPVSNDEADHQQFWKLKANREQELSTGNSDVDFARAQIHSASVESQNRQNSTTARYSIEPQPMQFDKKNYNFFKGASTDASDRKFIWTTQFDEFIDVNDLPDPLKKKKFNFKVETGADGDEEFVGRQTLPFSIYSSSVSGGIADKIVSNIGINADFGGKLHNELYGDFVQNPMQSTWTNHVVGGYRTRHQNTNYNLDGVDTRIENKYVILEPDNTRIGVYDVGTEKIENDAAGQADIDTTAWPKERLYRDFVAKSAWNIKNVKHTSSSPTIIGNYNKNYDYAQVGSRYDNNLWLRDQTGSVQPTPETYLREKINFELPDRGKNETAIVPLFSAPGDHRTLTRGYRDPESEVKSVYATLNYRNLDARKCLNDIVAGTSTNLTCTANWVNPLTPRIPAAGDPADRAGPTQYIATGEQYINIMVATHLSGECLIGSRVDQGVNSPLISVPPDGAPENWSVSNASPVTPFTQDLGGCAIDSAGEYAYIAVKEDGTGVAGTGEIALWRIDLSDGSVDYTAISDDAGEGGSNNANHVALDETNDRVYFEMTNSGDEIKQHVASTGTAAGVTLNDGGLGTLAGLCMSPNDDFVIAMGDSEFIAQWSTTGLSGLGTLFDGYSTDRVDFGSGGDTTLFVSSMQRNRGGAKLVPARDGSNTVWFCAGDSTSDDPNIFQYDPEVSTVANRIITEVDVSAMMDYVDTGTAHVRDLAVDKDGKIYALILPGSSNVDYDVVRLNADGTKDISFKEEGVTIIPFGTYGLATRLAVDEAYNVYVGTTDGYVVVYSQ